MLVSPSPRFFASCSIGISVGLKPAIYAPTASTAKASFPAISLFGDKIVLFFPLPRKTLVPSIIAKSIPPIASYISISATGSLSWNLYFLLSGTKPSKFLMMEPIFMRSSSPVFSYLLGTWVLTKMFGLKRTWDKCTFSPATSTSLVSESFERLNGTALSV